MESHGCALAEIERQIALCRIAFYFVHLQYHVLDSICEKGGIISVSHLAVWGFI